MKNSLKIVALSATLSALASASYGQTIIQSNPSTSGSRGAGFEAFSPSSVVDVSNAVFVRSRNISGSLRGGTGAVQFGTTAITNTVSSASLSLGLFANTAGNFSINIYGLNEGASRGSVTEANWATNFALTYDTMVGLTDPGSVPLSAIDSAQTTFLGSVDVSGTLANQTVTLNSTPELVSFLNADTNGKATFLISADNAPPGQDYFFQFLSPERSGSGSSSYPTLSVNQIPEPSISGILTGILALTLVAGRRRLRA